MSSSVHVANKGKDILIFGEGQAKGSDDTTLTAEAKYPINFTQPGKRFILNLQCNGGNSNLLMLQKYINSKQRTQKKRVSTVFRLGNISKGFTINNMKKQD